MTMKRQNFRTKLIFAIIGGFVAGAIYQKENS